MCLRCKGSNLAELTLMFQDMLYSRAVVLKAAADTLLDRASRFAYDQAGAIEFPQDDLPGTELTYLCCIMRPACSVWRPVSAPSGTS